MKIPLSWLNDYVKVDDIDPKELAEKLTRAGLQVESIEEVGGEVPDDLIVVAEVLECEQHPDSDHLHVCKVTDGKETFQVVCGAPNMRQGIKTAFAKIGAFIPEGGFKIKKGKLRGVESFGMCCSEKELHIGSGESGIIEYPAETPNGSLVRDVANVEKPETVFEVEVTWNRPDALSVVGLAREYAAILGRELKMPETDFTESERAVEDEVKVVVEDPAKCPRYTARVAYGIDVSAPSPEKMSKRLELCGVRSLSLAVDVTNYVMLELGQPLHAFDHTKLKDRTIVVRTAKDGETIKTLDGAERKLDPSMLVICDAEKPNAVAGVMGGEGSGIAADTDSVLLESALFDCASVKDTSVKLGLSSESSYRYIRGVDKDLADFASRRAMHLLQKHGGAKVAKGSIDVDSRARPLNPDVTLDFDRARRLIGIDIPNDRMVSILSALSIVPRTEGPCAGVKEVAFSVPSWRYDISLEADLVEEIARMNGLDSIPDAMPSAPSVSSLDDRAFRAESKVREICIALGFSEAMHYSFLSAKELDFFDAGDAAKRLAIPDPVSAEYSVMRSSLLPQMASTLGRNSSHEPDGAMLFEIGKAYGVAEGRPCETKKLALGFTGPAGREKLRVRVPVTAEDAVLWLKGAIEELVKRLHAGRVEFVPQDYAPFSPGAGLAVKINGKICGVAGAASERLRHPFRLTTQMALAEIDLCALARDPFKTGRVSAVSAFPAVRRDIALVAAKGVANESIVKTIRKSGGKDLAGVELFDIFKSKDLKDGSRSLAYALEFRSNERTLTDEEVARDFGKIVDALKACEGVETRES